MARNDKSIPHRFISLSSPHIVLVSSPVSFLRLVVFSLSPRYLSSRLSSRSLVLLLCLVFVSSSSLIRSVIVFIAYHLNRSSIRSYRPIVAVPRCPHIAPYRRVAFFAPCGGLINIIIVISSPH